MGTGRTDNYYIEGGFDSKDQINQAKQQLSQRVATLVGNFSSLADYQKIEKANKILINNVVYSFCNEQENLDKAPYIHPYRLWLSCQWFRCLRGLRKGVEGCFGLYGCRKSTC